MRSSILVTMVGFLAFLASCASLDPGVAMLDKYPGVKQQIMSYYNANATEESWGCNAVYMDNITEAKVIRETPQQIILGIHYFFISDMGGGRRGFGCEGFGTRVFTFTRSGGDYGLVSMSGEQRGNS